MEQGWRWDGVCAPVIALRVREGGRIIIKDKQSGRVRMSSVFAGASAETVDGVYNGVGGVW